MSQFKKKQGKTHLKSLMENGQGFTGFPWPENYRDFDIRIKRDGSWHYQNSPITRLELCQLFATVLQKDNEGEF